MTTQRPGEPGARTVTVVLEAVRPNGASSRRGARLTDGRSEGSFLSDQLDEPFVLGRLRKVPRLLLHVIPTRRIEDNRALRMEEIS